MRATHHLLRHPSGMYHFRLAVPADLQAVVGLRVIKRSVHTRDPRRAQVAAWRLAASYARAFDVLRRGTMGKTPPPVDEIVANFEGGRGREYVIDRKSGIFQADDAADHERLKETMRLATELARAEAEAELQKQATFDAKARAADAESRARAKREAAQLDAATAPIAGEKVFSASGFTVQQMIELWEAVGTGSITKETADTRKAILDHFAAHFGPNKPISAVRRQDVAAWGVHLAKHGMDGKPNDKGTRVGKYSHLAALFTCAMGKGHYDDKLDNPAERVETYAKGEKARLIAQRGMAPFTPAHLQQLFAPDNLAMVEMPHSRRAMVLGLYTGARISEIACLRLDDFKPEGGVHYMHLRGEKTESSERTVPLHPDLIRLGVLEWVKQEKAAGSTRLFPELNIERKSKGGAVSNATSNQLKRLGITLGDQGRKKKRLGFHSFRSTIIQALQEGSEEFSERRHAFVGHIREDEKRAASAQRKHYMRAWTPSEIAVLLDRITWGQWLDFERLRAVLAPREPDHGAIAAKRNAARAASRAKHTGKSPGRSPRTT